MIADKARKTVTFSTIAVSDSALASLQCWILMENVSHEISIIKIFSCLVFSRQANEFSNIPQESISIGTFR